MRAVRTTGYNVAPAIEEIEMPEMASDQVLVRVAAASLNPLDVKRNKGEMDHFFPLAFPYTIGTDLAGQIVRVGADATGWSEGDEVVTRLDPTSGGALADYAAVPASYLVRVPPSVSLTDAAGIGTAGATAWEALFEVAKLRRGQTILIHAGAGGVGSFAIQLAQKAGARVIATASGAGLELVRRLGADQVMDYRADQFWSMVSDIDVVLDTIGGETQLNSFVVLRAGGVLVSVVSPPDEALGKAHGVTGTFFPHMSDAHRLAKVVQEVAGGIRVLVDRELPLDKFDEAFALQASGRAHGKILLIP